MAKPGTEEQDLDLDEEETEETELDVEETDGDESEEEPKVEEKRVRDLQSVADKATARANKAEAALAKSTNLDGEPASGSKDPERAALMAELRDASLDAVFAEFTELRGYAIDRSLIDGRTRAEMRESATAIVGLIKSVETKARNRTLKEHGIVAEPAGATRSAPKNFADMSPEDFEKEITRAKSGGAPAW